MDPDNAGKRLVKQGPTRGQALKNPGEKRPSTEGKARGKQGESRGKARGKQVQKRVSWFVRVGKVPLFTVRVSSEIAPSYLFIILKGENQ